MILIVEGPDGAGKTTFIEQLRDLLPRAPIVVAAGPPDPPDRDPYEEYEQAIDSIVRDPLDIVIADRWHWGERVYGPLLRNRNRLGQAGWRHVELFMASRGAIVINIHQPEGVLIERIQQRGDDLIDIASIPELVTGYEECLRVTALPVISLRDPGPRETSSVAFVAAQRLFSHPMSHMIASYIGVDMPDALLFGERRGGKPPHADRAAFVPRPSTSGHYLLEALPSSLWPRLGIANVLEDNPRTVWELVGLPPVVALGRTAHEQLDRFEIPHATVPHPQFVRRFLHKLDGEYGELIASVVGTKDNRIGWRGTE